jgi:hypothetical protein
MPETVDTCQFMEANGQEFWSVDLQQEEEMLVGFFNPHQARRWRKHRCTCMCCGKLIVHGMYCTRACQQAYETFRGWGKGGFDK